MPASTGGWSFTPGLHKRQGRMSFQRRGTNFRSRTPFFDQLPTRQRITHMAGMCDPPSFGPCSSGAHGSQGTCPVPVEARDCATTQHSAGQTSVPRSIAQHQPATPARPCVHHRGCPANGTSAAPQHCCCRTAGCGRSSGHWWAQRHWEVQRNGYAAA